MPSTRPASGVMKIKPSALAKLTVVWMEGRLEEDGKDISKVKD